MVHLTFAEVQLLAEPPLSASELGQVELLKQPIDEQRPNETATEYLSRRTAALAERAALRDGLRDRLEKWLKLHARSLADGGPGPAVAQAVLRVLGGGDLA